MVMMGLARGLQRHTISHADAHHYLNTLPPSRRRVVIFLIHVLPHLLFRLFIVLLPGSLDGLARPVLGRKGTFEHGETAWNVVSSNLQATKERWTIAKSDTSWSKGTNKRRCGSHEHVKSESLGSLRKLCMRDPQREAQVRVVDSGRREKKNGERGDARYLKQAVR